MVGLALGAGFLLLFLSGGLLAVRAELEAARDPVAPVSPTGAPAPLRAVVNAAERRHPVAWPVELEPAPDATAPARVGLVAPTGDRIDVLVDPYRATVLASRWPSRSPLTAIGMLHAELYMGRWGRAAVGLLGLLLVLQGLTGLALWWPFLKRPGIGLRVRWRRPWGVVVEDAHRAVGVLSLGFSLPLALTGTVLAFGAAVAPAEPARGRAAPSARLALAAGAVDAAVRAAEATLPSGRVVLLRADPDRPDTVIAHLRLPGELGPRGQSVVVIDADRAAAREVRPAYRASLGRRLWALALSLHYGDFAGLGGRLVYAAGAVVSLGLVASGIGIWIGRRPGGRP